MTYSFSGLSPITQRIQALTPRLAYVVLYDRTDRNKTYRVGRFDVDETNVVNYLESLSVSSAYDDDDDHEEEIDTDYEDLLRRAYDLWEQSHALAPEIIAACVCHGVDQELHGSSCLRGPAQEDARQADGERRKPAVGEPDLLL